MPSRRSDALERRHPARIALHRIIVAALLGQPWFKAHDSIA
jgi:hypothetical protein